jgi:PHD/YefM family antitoxin component YafN of YafNO toxin-antitoxin module
VKKDTETASIKATDARSKDYRLIDEMNEMQELLVITGKGANAALV